jgi:hypothetical protein
MKWKTVEIVEKKPLVKIGQASFGNIFCKELIKTSRDFGTKEYI